MSTDPSTESASTTEETPPPAPPEVVPEESSRTKFRIAIGTQRDVADPKLATRRAVGLAENPVVSPPVTAESAVIQSAEDSSQTKATEETAIDPASKTEHPPDSLMAAPAQTSESPPVKLQEMAAAMIQDVESEIAAALAGISMEQIVERSAAPIAAVEVEIGSRIKSFVSRIEGDHVFFQLPGRHEGVASLRQFRKPPEPGTLVEIIVQSHNEVDGLYELVLPGAAVDAGDWSSLNVGDIVDARVAGSNTGGLEVTVNQLRGFIPASQIDRVRVEHFGEFVNQKLQCMVTEVNPQRKRLVLSRRALMDREYEEQRRQRLAEIQVGDTYEGLVTRLTDFGAFVDLGGIEGLVHISRLSWGHVKHPSEIVQVGQRIRVKVEKANPETGKFSLSHRDTTEHPWQRVGERFPVGAVVSGTVSRIAQFGAFVRLDAGIEGLIHISELSHGRVASVGQVVKEHQSVEVKILSLDEAAQRIALSLKATQPEPQVPDAESTKAAVEEPARSYAVPKQSQPLRGGKGRDSGGSQFGLNL
ncbi:MAG TPA: S1 RNA-binding domain-containing protein [Pirellulaceae bacterium]|nr:S1 RNA-binding domain-containing protein [Pirellulaceae bacterium]